MEKKNATIERNITLFLQKRDMNSLYRDTVELFTVPFFINKGNYV